MTFWNGPNNMGLITRRVTVDVLGDTSFFSTLKTKIKNGEENPSIRVELLDLRAFRKPNVGDRL